MKKNAIQRLSIGAAIFALLSSLSGLTVANPQVPSACSTADVKINSVVPHGSSTNLVNAAVNSFDCVGAFSGNDKFDPQVNLGAKGDGLFNGGMQNGNGPVLFPNGVFSNNFTAYDLNGDGVVDPGWIRLGSWAPGSGFSAATIGGKNIVGDWFTATVDPKSNSLAGNWSLTLPNNIKDLVGPVFGTNLFDHLLISIKGGNSFAAYDFSAAALGLPLDTPNDFKGTWDVTHTLTGGISHIDVYVRDPLQPGQNLPEPESIALVGAALMGLYLSTRRRRA